MWRCPTDEEFGLGGEAVNKSKTFTSPIEPLITRYLAVKRASGRRAVQMAYRWTSRVCHCSERQE